MGLPEQEQDALLAISKKKNLTLGGFFIAEGQVPEKFALVLSGLFRYYYISDKGVEFTKGFILPGQVMAAYTAMQHRSPSLFSIQALEPAVVLEVNYSRWLDLQRHNSFWDKFLIAALEKGYYTKEKRERELLLLDAETRYRIFLDEFPGLDKRVKLQVIASYLGIKPESLSRIRKKIRS